jgi:NAD(P)-dependent dehydrogenase (short-subunit alcohol dehydrogenase family)
LIGEKTPHQPTWHAVELERPQASLFTQRGDPSAALTHMSNVRLRTTSKGVVMAQPVGVVTGASSGIGRAAALALVDAGFTAVGTSRDAARATPPQGVTLLDLDVSSDDSVAALVENVAARFGRIDVLVNNAGVGTTGAVEEMSLAQHQRVLDVNVLGVIRMSKAVLPLMRAQGQGRIVNISSVLGLVPQPLMAAYAASKHAIEGFSESLDHEVREHGVRVVLVEPAYTSTAFDANAVVADHPQPVYAPRRAVFDEMMGQAIKMGDAPAVVAKAILAAASDPKPRLRYTAGSRAGRVSTLRRLVPARLFDEQIRKLNKMAG